MMSSEKNMDVVPLIGWMKIEREIGRVNAPAAYFRSKNFTQKMGLQFPLFFFFLLFAITAAALSKVCLSCGDS